jgi:ribonuclease R
MEIDIAIRSHGLPHVWPAEVEEELKAFGHEVPKAQYKGREELRSLPLVTIYGADAKDFDDAVYCEKKSKGWRLLVAIADVSAYVTPGSALDAEATSRGTSVYFPGRVVPMLPELLSNGLCSLNPDVDRLCMVCEMYVNREGKITRSRFLEGVMRSHARLTYDEVAAMLLEGDEALRGRHADLLPHLDELHNLYQVLRTAREARGAIDFDTTETRIVFGPGKKIDRILPVERNDAHKLIEECMIAANVAAARFVGRNKTPALYRVHDAPSGDKLTDLREFLAGVGLSLGGGDKPSPKDYEAVIRRVEGRPDQHLIHTVLLRSMSQAVYSPDNNGHFGLALDTYAHFTSPIRRYPDLLLHRAIRHLLRGGKPRDFDYTKEDMVTLGESCSATERRADEATRDAESWLKCEYMMDKVGEEFDGIISTVTSFGLFVELQGIYVEGLAHVTSLGDDYYHFDPVRRRMQGERTGRIFGLADPIRVKVVRVSLDDRKIDFEPVEAAAKPKKKSGGRRRRRR